MEFQERYDTIRDKSSTLAARNPGAVSQLMKFAKQAGVIRKAAEAAGSPVTVRPKGWTK